MSDIMKKVNDRGEVAVLVSYGYGAGWYSWNDNLQMLFDPEIVDYVLYVNEQGFDSYTKQKMIISKFKSKYPDAILLFRVGDFYETFGSDAVKASQVLGITLTKRANGSASHIELAGFPHHSLDSYLPKLVRILVS